MPAPPRIRFVPRPRPTPGAAAEEEAEEAAELALAVGDCNADSGKRSPSEVDPLPPSASSAFSRATSSCRLRRAPVLGPRFLASEYTHSMPLRLQEGQVPDPFPRHLAFARWHESHARTVRESGSSSMAKRIRQWQAWSEIQSGRVGEDHAFKYTSAQASSCDAGSSLRPRSTLVRGLQGLQPAAGERSPHGFSKKTSFFGRAPPTYVIPFPTAHT